MGADILEDATVFSMRFEISIPAYQLTQCRKAQCQLMNIHCPRKPKYYKNVFCFSHLLKFRRVATWLWYGDDTKLQAKVYIL